MSQSQVRTNAEKYNFTAEKAHFAKSSRQGLENLRSDLPKLEFHADPDHDAVRIINNGQMLYKLSPIAEGLSPITNRRNLWVMSGRFSKTQMMRASAVNYAALNKHCMPKLFKKVTGAYYIYL